MEASDKFTSTITHAADKFSKLKSGRILLLHHNDADGLSAGAVLVKAFERAGRAVSRYCLEKPYPIVLQKILSPENLSDCACVFITDFGSGMLSQFEKLVADACPIFVLDHHQIEAGWKGNTILVNPLGSGILGKSASSSTVACLFAVALNSWNKDLSWMGVLGAVGDDLIQDGRLTAFNQEVFKTAKELGFVNESYVFQIAGVQIEARSLSAQIDALGSIGYFRGGPDIAIKGLHSDLEHGFFESALQFDTERKLAFSNFISDLKLETTKHVSWFDLKDSFSEYGVKTVGLLCEEIVASGKVAQDRYLAGFQQIPPVIPGLGPVDLKETKLSMRVGVDLARKIEAGAMPSLTQTLPSAAYSLGGLVDACHPTAAAVVVSIGQEATLIEKLEAEIALQISKIDS